MSSGYDDWKHAARDLARHETSETHIQSIETLLTRRKAGEHISKRLTEQFESEKKYWNDILLRILTKRANKGRSHVLYLSSTICDEFIHVLSRDVLDHILTEIKKAKYFAVSVDSTPDISHVDQLNIIFRYITSKGPVERFVTFIPTEEHTGEGLATKLLDSTSRWNRLMAVLKPLNMPTLKRLSDTRWSVHYDAVHSLQVGYTQVKSTLDIMCQNMSQKPETRLEAAGLKDIMSHHETGILVQLWSKTLNRFNLTSKYLQGTDMDLNTATELLRSLGDFVHSLRSQFTALEKEEKDLGTDSYKGKSRRKRKRNQRWDYGDSEDLELSPSDKFKVQCFLPIVDQLLVALKQRANAYDTVSKRC
ncbi:uncharacterized protein LOC105845816 isoform X1 [Hydra vulgaris]|uniref:uncharacterized protein LOC105845816 isoform X1 n=1 Tax=Hydra vulgaris TaxID=6087 RepID=UPI0032EA0AE3